MWLRGEILFIFLEVLGGLFLGGVGLIGLQLDVHRQRGLVFVVALFKISLVVIIFILKLLFHYLL